MPVVKTVAFIKQSHGNVTLLDFNTGEVTASFVGSQNLIKDTANANRFFISSLADTSRRGISVDFRTIDGTQCVPIIETENFDLLLVDLAKYFFFLDSGVAVSQKATTYNDLTAGEIVGEIAYVEQSQGTRWLIGSLGGTYYPNGWYLWNGTSWISDRNAIANAINEISQNQGIQGLKGDTGDTGAQGIQGEKGDKGDTGDFLQNVDGGVIF